LIGAESEDVVAAYDSRLPTVFYDRAPGSPVIHASLDRPGVRTAAYAQLDVWALPSLETVVGARADRSAFATNGTLDPRVSSAWRPFGPLTIIGSAGIYHQVADPAFLEQASNGRLPALSASMLIGGAQLGDGTQFVRVEAWQKRYRDLVGLTREFTLVPGLGGRASGADLFARGAGPLGTRLRITWSMSRSRREDPDTHLDAPAPFDITNSITGVVERDWSNGWHVGIADRLATGRPFTDVVGASVDTARDVYVPVYGEPFGARLPAYQRFDLAVSRTAVLSGGRFLALFGGIQNPLNHKNLFSYTWTRDYAARVPVPSAVNRALFVGANLVLSRNP
jgi:hypothetical protein